MDDKQIIDLYFSRSEQAIRETETRYGRYCYGIAYHILHSREDSEECVNDTYMTAWKQIPPTRPNYFSVYLGRITRGLSIDRWRRNHSQKRGSGQLSLAIHELEESISTGDSIEDTYINGQIINTFLRSLPVTERDVFICRYWYLDSIKEIAADFGFSESKVKSMLKRTRDKFSAYICREGAVKP